MIQRSDISYLTINGLRLEMDWVNRKAATQTTLVFLHEGLGSTTLWRDFPYKLSKRCNCRGFIYSRFGYGASDPCPLPRSVQFMHDEGLEVLPLVLNATGIDDYILIGHSDGGSIALIHAGGAPGQGLRGVITEAAHVSCEPFNLASIQQARETYLTTDLRQKLQRYHGENVDTAFWGWNDVWLHPDFVHWNIESFLTNISVPVLAIQGEEDNYGTPAQVEAIADQAGAGAETLMLPSCGHAPHRDHEKIVVAAIDRYVSRLVD